jgi:hypothetical protein
VIGQQGCKQQEQIGDGEGEQPVRRATVGCGAAVQLKCEQEKKRAADGDDAAVDRARKAKADRQLRRENEERAVDQNLQRRCGA